MRSPDEGISWEPVTPELHKDVHQVATCPADDNRVYANTQNGVYISADRGNSWVNRIEGLPRRYGTGVAVHPADPDLTDCHSPKRTERRWRLALSLGEWRRDVDATQRSTHSIH